MPLDASIWAAVDPADSLCRVVSLMNSDSSLIDKAAEEAAENEGEVGKATKREDIPDCCEKGDSVGRVESEENVFPPIRIGRCTFMITVEDFDLQVFKAKRKEKK